MLGRLLPIASLLVFLSFDPLALGATERQSPLEKQLLTKVLQPWVTAHYPSVEFTGHGHYSKKTYSWSFRDKSDPKGQPSFPLDVEMDSCVSLNTARRNFHSRDDITIPGTVFFNAGDEAFGYDARLAKIEGLPEATAGGWMRCRVGTFSFSIQSTSVKFEDLIDLTQGIAAEARLLPPVPKSQRQRVEAGFLCFLRQQARKSREAAELKRRIAEKEFTTPYEYYRQFRNEHPDYQPKNDDNEIPAGGRRSPMAQQELDSPVTEISLERADYAVQITADGKVRYFGKFDVKRLGNHTGKISKFKFLQLAEYIEDSKVMDMHEDYVDVFITDQEQVTTSFVISGKRKTIFDYASSAPSSLWAIEELIDRLVSETEWAPNSPNKDVKKR